MNNLIEKNWDELDNLAKSSFIHWMDYVQASCYECINMDWEVYKNLFIEDMDYIVQEIKDMQD